MLSFEMDYFHFLDMLQMGRIPQLAAERGEQDPLVLIGGPCATFNPEPLAPFVDAAIIGEGEEVLRAPFAENAGEAPGRRVREVRDRRQALLAEALEYSFAQAGDERTTGGDGRLRAMIEQCLPLPGEQETQWVLWVELWLRAVRRPELRRFAAEQYARLTAQAGPWKPPCRKVSTRVSR